ETVIPEFYSSSKVIIQWEIKYTTTKFNTITTPPMVEVPRLLAWLVGPSSRIICPYPRLCSNRINKGVPTTVRNAPSTAPNSNPITYGICLWPTKEWTDNLWAHYHR